MLYFIFRFPKSNKNQVFLINTRAGMKFGKLFITGLSGVALLFSALILKFKKYKIIGMRSIDLPSNWISLHPGLKPSAIESIFVKRKNDTISFITKLLEGKKSYSAFKDIIQDMIVAPIAVLYYIFARFIFSKSFIASKDCTHCNLCIEQCPVNAIKLVDKRCFWTYKCESCMQCMNTCPHRAIETAHGFIIGLSYLVYAVILVWLYEVLNIEYFEKTSVVGGYAALLLFAFNSAIYLMFIFLGYRIMHYLLRFRFFERVFVYTSFTKYKFWKRYKPFKKV
jgi:ferredoxin